MPESSQISPILDDAQTNRAKSNSTVESLPIGIFEIDRDNTICFINPVAKELMKPYNLPEVMGWNFLEIISEPNKSEVKRILKEAFECNKPDYEFRGYYKTGCNHFAFSCFIPIMDEENNVIKVLCVIEPLDLHSDQRITLKDYDALEEMISSVLPVMVWASDVNKKCIFFNRYWLEFTGRTIHQELGDGWAEGVHPDDLEHCLNIYTESFDKRINFRMEYRIRRHDGKYRWVVDNGVPRYDSDGTFTGYIGTCLDITDEKDSQIHLTLSRQKLEDSIKSKSIQLEKIQQELMDSQEMLNRKNDTLTEVLNQFESNKESVKNDIVMNLETALIPTLNKLRRLVPNEGKLYLDIMEKNIKNISSSFGAMIPQLTPSEIEICNMIRTGLRTKEIASSLHCSELTVNTHRNRIRKKLGILNKKVNLTSYLKTQFK